MKKIWSITIPLHLVDNCKGSIPDHETKQTVATYEVKKVQVSYQYIKEEPHYQPDDGKDKKPKKPKKAKEYRKIYIEMEVAFTSCVDYTAMARFWPFICYPSGQFIPRHGTPSGNQSIDPSDRNVVKKVKCVSEDATPYLGKDGKIKDYVQIQTFATEARKPWWWPFSRE